MKKRNTYSIYPFLSIILSLLSLYVTSHPWLKLTPVMKFVVAGNRWTLDIKQKLIVCSVAVCTFGRCCHSAFCRGCSHSPAVYREQWDRKIKDDDTYIREEEGTHTHTNRCKKKSVCYLIYLIQVLRQFTLAYYGYGYYSQGVCHLFRNTEEIQRGNWLLAHKTTWAVSPPTAKRHIYCSHLSSFNFCLCLTTWGGEGAGKGLEKGW